MSEYTKPLPVPDELTLGFWEATKKHALAFQRCQHCGYYAHPPVIFCSHCNALEPSFVWEPVSGRGTVLSWVVMNDAFTKGFEDEIPWVLVRVVMEEQPDLIFLADLQAGSEAPLQIGTPVEVTFEDVNADITIPHLKRS